MGRVVDRPLDELPPRLRKLERRWRELLAECEASGTGITPFARARGISASSMFNWRAELARRDRARATARPEPEVAFLPVAVRRPDAPAAPPLEVVLATGRSIRVGGDFDAAVLARLVRLLEDLPC